MSADQRGGIRQAEIHDHRSACGQKLPDLGRHGRNEADAGIIATDAQPCVAGGDEGRHLAGRRRGPDCAGPVEFRVPVGATGRGHHQFDRTTGPQLGDQVEHGGHVVEPVQGACQQESNRVRAGHR